MGRRVLDGSKQVSMLGKEGKVEVVTINSSVERLDGFSGHSDYNQLMSFVQRLRPKLRRVLVNHGERKKSENLAMNIRRMYRSTCTLSSNSRSNKIILDRILVSRSLCRWSNNNSFFS